MTSTVLVDSTLQFDGPTINLSHTNFARAGADEMEPDFLVAGFEAIQAHQKDPPFDGFWRFDVEHPAPKKILESSSMY